MDNFEYGISNKGGQTIIYKGFEFVRHRETATGTIHWRCAKFRTLRCRSLLHTRDNNIIREPSDHCHANRTFEAAAHKVANQMKMEMSHPGATARSVIADNLVNVSDGIKICLPKKSSLTRRLNGSKAKTLGNVPANPNNKNFEIPEKYANWIIHDSGADDPERIILIGHKTLLDLLVVNDFWLADGTFKVVPEIYYQLYSIHVQYESGIALPCLLALLPGKEERIYVKMLNMLLEKIPQARPRKILTDFETAAMKAFRTVFENIEIGGCFFHLSQSILRKVNECGLKSLYESNQSFAIHIKMLLSLALIPEEEVLELFLEVADLFSDLDEYNEQMEQILLYFERTYVRGRQLRNGTYKPPLFNISIWNHSQSAANCIARTTNCIEGWHYGLQSLFQCSHPTVWKFLDNIVKELSLQHTNYLQDLTGQRNPGRVRYISLKQRISNIVQNYDSNRRLDFLRCIAHMT